MRKSAAVLLTLICCASVVSSLNHCHHGNHHNLIYKYHHNEYDLLTRQDSGLRFGSSTVETALRSVNILDLGILVITIVTIQLD